MKKNFVKTYTLFLISFLSTPLCLDATKPSALESRLSKTSSRPPIPQWRKIQQEARQRKERKEDKRFNTIALCSIFASVPSGLLLGCAIKLLYTTSQQYINQTCF